MTDWVARVLYASKKADRKRGQFDEIHFITRNYVERIWLFQKQLCHYCCNQMQIKDRRKPDGCTIERLDNNFGHTIRNCVLACWKCNCGKAYGDMWKKIKKRKRDKQTITENIEKHKNK